MRRRGLKGAVASQRAKGLDSSALGPLKTHEDAKRWLEAIGRGVLSGSLGDRAATAGIKAVDSWTKTEGERLTVQVVEDLARQVDELKAELRTRPQLRSLP